MHQSIYNYPPITGVNWARLSLHSPIAMKGFFVSKSNAKDQVSRTRLPAQGWWVLATHWSFGQAKFRMKHAKIREAKTSPRSVGFRSVGFFQIGKIYIRALVRPWFPKSQKRYVFWKKRFSFWKHLRKNGIGKRKSQLYYFYIDVYWKILNRTTNVFFTGTRFFFVS